MLVRLYTQFARCFSFIYKSTSVAAFSAKRFSSPPLYHHFVCCCAGQSRLPTGELVACSFVLATEVGELAVRTRAWLGLGGTEVPVIVDEVLVV